MSSSYRELLNRIAQLERLRHEALVKTSNGELARSLRDEGWRLRREAYGHPDPTRFAPLLEKAMTIDARLNALADEKLLNDERYQELKDQIVEQSKAFVSKRRR